jgi:hypothetical protein
LNSRGVVSVPSYELLMLRAMLTHSPSTKILDIGISPSEQGVLGEIVLAR